MESHVNVTIQEGDIIELNSSIILEDFIIIPPETQSDNCGSNKVVAEYDIGSNRESDIVEEVVNQSNKTRKRKVSLDNWKRNYRKQQYQSGKSYTSSRGKIVAAKELKSKKDCFSHCRLNCAKKI